MVVPKHYSVDERIAMAKVDGELHLRVLRIVLADKASNKSNNDHLPTTGPAGGKWTSGTETCAAPGAAKIADAKTKANILNFQC